MLIQGGVAPHIHSPSLCVCTVHAMHVAFVCLLTLVISLDLLSLTHYVFTIEFTVNSSDYFNL